MALSTEISHHGTFSKFPSIRRFLPYFLWLCCGFVIGVYLNYYGLIFESIRVTVNVDVIQNRSVTATGKGLLSSLLTNSSRPAYVVPNIVHYIWFTKDRDVELKFIHYVSIISAYKIHRPEQILFHCDTMPTGHWWKKLWLDVPLQVLYRSPPNNIHGQRLWRVYHQADVAKLEVLMEYGGIYLDYDVLVVNSLDPLRIYDATLGKERPPELNAGVILAKQNAMFIQLMHKSYKDNYRPLDWDYNCARVAYKMYEQRPDLLHVELTKFTTPDAQDRHLLYKETIDWKDLYVIHVLTHDRKEVYDPESIKTLGGTIGEVMRYIYYGSPKIIR